MVESLVGSIPFPVHSLTAFGGLPRIANDCVELTLHDCAPGSLAALRGLVDAGLTCIAHVTISLAGEVRLVGVQASDSVTA